MTQRMSEEFNVIAEDAASWVCPQPLTWPAYTGAGRTSRADASLEGCGAGLSSGFGARVVFGRGAGGLLGGGGEVG